MHNKTAFGARGSGPRATRNIRSKYTCTGTQAKATPSAINPPRAEPHQTGKGAAQNKYLPSPQSPKDCRGKTAPKTGGTKTQAKPGVWDEVHRRKKKAPRFRRGRPQAHKRSKANTRPQTSKQDTRVEGRGKHMQGGGGKEGSRRRQHIK